MGRVKFSLNIQAPYLFDIAVVKLAQYGNAKPLALSALSLSKRAACENNLKSNQPFAKSFL